MNDSIQSAIQAFLSQPWGVVGALAIMFAVTAFNSRSLRAQLRRLNVSDAAMPLVLNGFNLLGGACLFVNAVLRHEIVWIVLEVYFVAVAVKGLLAHRAAAGERREEMAADAA
ncbi:MAG: hypothetical protein QM820_39465 [Minicystis sp.]